MPLDTGKLTALKAIKRPKVGEIAAVYFPAPIGTKYYGSTALQDLPNFADGLTLKPVEPRFSGFHDFELSADIGDDTITFDFSDQDQAIAELFESTGQGIKVEIFLWFPEVDWLTSVWWGLLRPPKGADYESYVVDASAGFMSQLIPTPRRGFYVFCPFTFGGTLETQTEITASNSCLYNRHVGGSLGLLNAGVPFTSCSKSKSDCIARWGDALSFGGFDTAASPIVSDPRTGVVSFSRGNETNLKRPLRVILGAKNIRNLDLLAWRRYPNNNTPDKGFVAGVWAVCEGSNYNILNFKVNDVPIGFNDINYRFGDIRQPATFYPGNISNFSGSAHIFAVYGWVNAQNTDGNDLKTFCSVLGQNNVRTYSDENTYVEQWTRNRVWHLLHIYRNRRWGRGYADSRFYIPSWIDTANWTVEQIRFTDPLGNTYDDYRNWSDLDLQGRPTQQQITDICRAGRISVPFQSEGKYKIVPLRKEADLNAVPIFTDVGETRNICRDERGKPILNYSIISDAEIANKIVLTFEDRDNEDVQRPLVFEDEQQQLAAGRALGDSGLHVVEKRYDATGLVFFNQVVKLGWSLLHLGEFDSGGLRNNLRINFTTWLVDALELEKYKVIRVVSPLLARYGFEYFRVLNLRRRKDLKVNVIAQAYPESYYATFETPISGLPTPEDTTIVSKTSSLNFGSVSYADGKLSVEITV